MSSSVITLAFEHWKAQEAATGKAIVLDEFVFALIPELDPNKPIDRNESLPETKYIVDRQAVNKAGLASENAVAYSVTLGTDVGDYDFNWIGLLNKATGTVAMITHAPIQKKTKTKDGQQGNVLTRSFLLEFIGAAKETAINTTAETWQIDFTARLSGIDEIQRLINQDNYGLAAFFADGFQVVRSGEQFTVKKGLGYVGGLRGQLMYNQILNNLRNIKVYVDFSFQGNLVSQWNTVIKITTATDLKNYIDAAGFTHQVYAIASIDASGEITDLRPKPTAAMQDEKIKELLDQIEKVNNGLASKVSKTQTINGIPMNTPDIPVTPDTVFNKYNQLDDKSVLHSFRSPGLYLQESGTATTTTKGYPFKGAKGILIVWPTNTQSNVIQEWLDANGSRWSRTYNHPLWTEWAQDYSSQNKPTAADVGAVDTSTGEALSTRITNAQNTANQASKTANSAQKDATSANDNAELRALKTTTVNGFPLSSNVLLASKDIFKNMTDLALDNLSNIFAPGIYYQKTNASALWSRNYPKDGVGGVLVVYRTNQGATTANNACVQVYYSNENIVYTRVYNGSSWVGGWATQVNTATGMTNIRLGTKTRYSPPGNTVSWNWEAPAGNVLTGLVIDDTGNNSADNVSGAWYRPLQYYINGSWLTAESL